MGAFLINLAVTAVLLACGYLIKHRRWYWLIAGYNTASAAEKKNYDIAGLASFLGNGLFVLAGLWLAGALGQYLGRPVVFLVFIALFVCALIYIVFTSQKYHGDPRRPQRTTRIEVKIALALIISVSVFIGGLLVYGSRPAKLALHPGSVEITGMYGRDLPCEQVLEVTLKEALPQVRGKRDGFDFGSLLKGDFELQGMGKARLFLYTDRPPYIHLRLREGHVWLNFPDRQATTEAFTRLSRHLAQRRSAAVD